MKTLSTAAAAIALACLAVSTHQAAAFPAPGASLDRPADIIQVKKKNTEPAPKPKADPNKPPIKFDGIQGEAIESRHGKWTELARRRR